METIKIAPDLDEIKIDDKSISIEWNRGITYTGDIALIRKAFKDDWIIKQFQTAIALCSKPWQLERILNYYFKIDGKIS